MPRIADGVGAAQDRRDVVRLVDAVHEHREIGLAAAQGVRSLAKRSGVMGGAHLTPARRGAASCEVLPLRRPER